MINRNKLILLALIFFPAILFAAPLSTNTGFIYPADMKHSESDYIGFGERNIFFGNRCHLANDYSIAEGSPVYATDEGVVVQIFNNIPFYGGDDGSFGTAMIIRHLIIDQKPFNTLNPFQTISPFYALYGHIKNLTVGVGSNVIAGQKIAEVGEFISNGNNLPHLHFGININEPSFLGYTPTTACTDQLGFVDPEQFMKTNQSSNNNPNNGDDNNNDDNNSNDSGSGSGSGSGSLNFYTIVGLLLLLSIRRFGVNNRIFRRKKL